MKDIDDVESFMVKHGENIVDMMGAEIDRIEVKLRVSLSIVNVTFQDYSWHENASRLELRILFLKT